MSWPSFASPKQIQQQGDLSAPLQSPLPAVCWCSLLPWLLLLALQLMFACF